MTLDPLPTPSAQDRASFAESAGFGVLSFGTLVVIGLVTAVVTARIYGVTVMGEFALAYAPTGAVWFLSTVREQPALVREIVPLGRRAPRITGLWVAVFTFSFALTLVVSLIAVAVVWVLFHGPIDHPHLVVPAATLLGGYLVVTNTCWNLDTVLTSFRAGRQLFWIRLNQVVANLALAMAAAIVLDSVWGLILATIASWGTALVHRLVTVRHYMRMGATTKELRAGFRALPDILRFGLRVTPGALAEGTSNETATWTLGVIANLHDIGAYSRAWTLCRRFVELNWRISEMLFPTLVQKRQQDDHSGFDRTLVDTLRYVAVGMLLPGIAAGGAAHSVMALFGSGFVRGSGALAVLLVIPGLATMSTTSNAVWLATHRPWLTTKLLSLRLAVILVAVPLLTLQFGVTGAALGMLTGYIVEVGLQLIMVRRTLDTPMHVLWRAREVAGLAIGAGGGFATARLLELALSPGVAALAPSVVAGCIVAIALYLLVAGMTPRDVRRLRAVRDRARRMLPSHRRRAVADPSAK